MPGKKLRKGHAVDSTRRFGKRGIGAVVDSPFPRRGKKKGDLSSMDSRGAAAAPKPRSNWSFGRGRRGVVAVLSMLKKKRHQVQAAEGSTTTPRKKD